MKNELSAKKDLLKGRIRKLRASSSASVEDVPKITNETVAHHREQVLTGGRKLTYPIIHSRHRIVLISTLIVFIALIVFSVVTIAQFYRIKSTSDFTYQTSKIVPLPIAKVGPSFVSYESYLFQLKRYIHYYENVEKIDFTDARYAPQLEDRKKKILEEVVDQGYVKKIAADNALSVSEQEIDDRLALLKDQNRLGNSDKVFEDTLRDYYGWSIQDFRRSIRGDILTSKVHAHIDTAAQTTLTGIKSGLAAGTDFGALAATYSADDQTKATGGEIVGVLSPTDKSISSERLSALSRLKPGEVSEPINVGYGYEIIKKIEDKDSGYRAAHIIVAFKPLSELLNDEKAKTKATVYIKI
jgi:SurA N-terminal domain/PPIC-type PPIASE domain